MARGKGSHSFLNFDEAVNVLKADLRRDNWGDMDVCGGPVLFASVCLPTSGKLLPACTDVCDVQFTDSTASTIRFS